MKFSKMLFMKLISFLVYCSCYVLSSKNVAIYIKIYYIFFLVVTLFCLPVYFTLPPQVVTLTYDNKLNTWHIFCKLSAKKNEFSSKNKQDYNQL